MGPGADDIVVYKTKLTWEADSQQRNQEMFKIQRSRV